MALESIVLLMPREGTSFLELYFAGPSVALPYHPALAWVRPWPEPFMSIEVAAMGVFAAALALGFRHRLAAAGVGLVWTHVWLIDASLYNNHHYLMSLLAGLLVVTPAGTPALGAPRPVRMWAIWLLRFQLFCVYFYAGIAKLSREWLLFGEPMRTQVESAGYLATTNALFPAAWAAWLQRPAFGDFLSRSGLVVDLLVGVLLLAPRTRLLGVALLVGFHGFNHAVLFDDIGLFPLLGLLSTSIFLPPDWPRRLTALWQRRALPRPDWGMASLGAIVLALAGGVLAWPLGSAAFFFALAGLPVGLLVGYRLADDLGPPTDEGRGLSAWAMAALVAFAGVQLLLPLRHFASDGAVAWTGEGGRFAWRMKSHVKAPGPIRIRLDDPSWRGFEGAAVSMGARGQASPDEGDSLLPRWRLVEVDPHVFDGAHGHACFSVWGVYTGERFFAPAATEGDPPALRLLDRASFVDALSSTFDPAGPGSRVALAALRRAHDDGDGPGFREALALLVRLDPATARSVLARTAPFVEDGANGFAGLERMMPSDEAAKAACRAGRVLTRPQPAGVMLHPDLPLVVAHESRSGRRELLWNPRAELGDRQARKLRTEPDLLRGYARAISERWAEATGGPRPRVFVDAWAALVPYSRQRLVDPLVDLADPALDRADGAAWILPLDAEAPVQEGKSPPH